MRRRFTWLCRLAYWLAYHRNLGRALWVTENEQGAW